MKVLKLFLIFGLFFVVTNSVAQPSYPIVCRGGGSMHFNYTPFSNLSNQPQIWISYQKGAQGVGMGWENIYSLQPGQCSWQDRAVSANEPSRIVLLKVNNFAIQWQNGKVTGISTSAPHVSVLQDSNRYQSFDVYNDGRGNFIVTRIGQSR